MANRSTAPRRFRFGVAILAALTGAVMLLTLFTLEPPTPDLRGSVGGVGNVLIQLISVTAAVAIILGILNLIGANLRGGEKFPANLYGVITVITLVAVVGVRLVERLTAANANPTTLPTKPLSLTLYDVLQTSVESALAGLLFFFLVYAAYRLLRRRLTLWTLLFALSLIIVVAGYSTFGGFTFLTTVREWLLAVPVNGGMRGLLIGVALGVVIVGARVFVGQDRTFGE
ncbi:MAG TPA: hypothetical protein PLD47_05755 [Aggregatilineales bacterium]|nr:hypothetical protein [Anaerolineales bacterium]HRE47212.1 hypothetical protein [Aggregatilineales bacterium]